MRLPTTCALLSLFLVNFPASAVPALGSFHLNDVGIMGCQGAAGKRGAPSWDGLKYAAWELVNNGESGTMTISINGSLKSFPYTNSFSGGSSKRTHLLGRLGQYNVVLFIDWTDRIGYESSGGNGALRIYTDTPGDSQSIPITAVQGC